MPTLVKQAEELSRNYVRGGSTDNRLKQMARLNEFLTWTAQDVEVRNLHQVGARHVIRFWKSHRHLSQETSYKYWLAIDRLWRWLDKREPPPKPVVFKASSSNGENESDDAIITTSIQDLANQILRTANLDTMSVEDIALVQQLENGSQDFQIGALLRLLKKHNSGLAIIH